MKPVLFCIINGQTSPQTTNQKEGSSDMITNATINSKTRTFTETETKQPHACTKETIEWDKLPDLTESSDNIIWYGKCAVCGREVEELYTQEPELYDSKTHEEIERP